MGQDPLIPSTFRSIQSFEPEAVPLVVRDNLDSTRAAVMLRAIDAVAWGDLWHAYGPAEDVRDQLIAATVGDERTREVAWWNLFGNIHHQGTIYEATVPAVPIMEQLATSTGYPDRVDALAFLVDQVHELEEWAYAG